MTGDAHAYQPELWSARSLAWEERQRVPAF